MTARPSSSWVLQEPIRSRIGPRTAFRRAETASLGPVVGSVRALVRSRGSSHLRIVLRRTLHEGSIVRSRCAMSLAALRVKVSAAMRAGSLRPVRTRWAIRAQITRVFPDPGPAMTRIGPSGAVTASRWRSLSVARSCSWSYRAVDLSGTVVGMSDGMVREEEVGGRSPTWPDTPRSVQRTCTKQRDTASR